MTDVLDCQMVLVEATLIDAGAPVVILLADAVGLTGSETPSEVDARPDVLALLEDLRRQGAVKMALASDKASAARAIPKLALVAAASGDDADLRSQADGVDGEGAAPCAGHHRQCRPHHGRTRARVRHSTTDARPDRRGVPHGDTCRDRDHSDG